MEVTAVDRAASRAVTDGDREHDWLALVPRAMGKSGLSHKAMAIDLDMDRGLLSAQLLGAPNKHLSFRRMWRLSPDFWRELVLLIIDFYGITLALSDQDRRDLELGRTVRQALERSLAR
jgi:hypothetical protein